MTVQLEHIDRFTDRHGKKRIYYRAPGCKRVSLPAEDDPGFLAAYHAAVEQAKAAGPGEKKRHTQGEKGTFDHLAFEYYQTVAFKKLKASTAGVRQGIIDAFCQKHRHRLVK